MQRWAWVRDLYGSYGAGGVNHPDFQAKVKKYALLGISIHGDQINPTQVASLRKLSLAVRIHREEDSSDPVELANMMSQDITDAGCDGKQCYLVPNLETKNFDGYVLPFFERLVKIRPNRYISWVLEGHQGGLFPKELQDFLKAHPNITTTPENYGGNMNHLPWTDQQLLDDVTRFGIKAKLMFTSMGLGPNNISKVDGGVFTFEDLPN